MSPDGFQYTDRMMYDPKPVRIHLFIVYLFDIKLYVHLLGFKTDMTRRLNSDEFLLARFYDLYLYTEQKMFCVFNNLHYFPGSGHRFKRNLIHIVVRTTASFTRFNGRTFPRRVH